MYEDCFKYMLDLYSNPLFKKGFFDFFIKVQQEGIESARKFWTTYTEKTSLTPLAPEMFEKIVDFYIVLGFVPRHKYDEALKEVDRLKEENAFLRNTISELQVNVLKEGGEKAQEMWREVVDKQLDMNKEIAQNFFDLFRQLKTV